MQVLQVFLGSMQIPASNELIDNGEKNQYPVVIENTIEQRTRRG